jgi:hypothetical protein
MDLEEWMRERVKIYTRRVESRRKLEKISERKVARGTQ